MMANEDEQTASIKWSEELLGAFPAMSSKTELGLQVVKDMLEFYRARAKIEDEYAKKLSALHKATPGTGFFTKDPAISKEYKTLRGALKDVLDKGVKASEAHQEFANKVNNDICKNLENWIKNKTNDRVKILTEAQKHVKAVADAKANVARTKGDYERLMKEADVAQEQMIKAEKDESSQPDNKKLPPLTKKAAEKFLACKQKGKASEDAYQGAVKKANEELANKAEKMPVVVDSLQKWEEDRWNTLLGSVRSFKSSQEIIPTALEQYMKDLVSSYESGNLEEDFKEFIEANKKTEPEETIEFSAFKSKFQDTEEKKESENKSEVKDAEPQPAKEKSESQVEEKKKEPEANLFQDSEFA